MSNTVTFQINIGGNVFAGVGKLQGEFNQVVNVVGQLDRSVNQSFNNLKGKIQSISMTSLINQVKEVSAGLANISAPGIGFEQGMADLSSLTGIVGDDFKQLGKIARQTGIDSGLGAKAAAEALTVIASQKPVDEVGMEGVLELQKKAIVLSHAADMAMNDAAMSLAGTVNQFDLAVDQSDRVINVLAAGSKFGAANILDLADSFKIVGSQSSIAGVSLEETTGLLEVLSKNNVKGAEAGTKLRNIILSLQTVFGADLKNMTVSEALDQLKPKMDDATFMAQSFGRESMAAAQYLIKNSEAIADMTEKVTGTETAFEQAAVRTETVQQMMLRCRAQVDDLKIGFFELTGSFGGYATIVAEQAVTIAQLLPLLSLLRKGIGFVTSAQKLQALWSGVVTTATKVWTGAQWLFNSALWACPLTWIVAAIIALIGVIYVCVAKVEGWGKQWESVVTFMKLSGELFVESFKHGFNSMINGIMIGLDYVKLGWYKFKAAIGMGDSDENQEMISKISGDIDRRKKEIVDGAEKIKQLSQDAKDSLTWELSWKKDEPGTDAMTLGKKAVGLDIPVSVTPTSGGAVPELNLDGKGSKGKGKSTGGSTKTDTLDLNKIVHNLKGSTDYSAIASKMAPVVIGKSEAMQPVVVSVPEPVVPRSKADARSANPLGSIMQAAAALALPLALPLTMEATTLPQDKTDKAPSYGHTEYVADNKQKTVTMQKFCDNIVIHVANTDNKGRDQIQKEVRAALEDLLDDYA